MTRLEEAFARIDSYNALDPRPDSGGAEVLYGQRMSARLGAFAPDASEPLQIAVRAQHIGRWRLLRGDYPPGRAGYRRWRSELALLHAESAASIMREVGYGEAEIERMEFLIRKRGLASDGEAQTLEDVACLVFVEYYLADFIDKHEEPKWASVVAKTWKKMSPAGRERALDLAGGGPLAELLARALAQFPGV